MGTRDIEMGAQDMVEMQKIDEQIKELEKKIQRAADVEAIKVLMAPMQWTFGLDTNVKKTPGLCFGQGEGYIYGNFMKRSEMLESAQMQAPAEGGPQEEGQFEAPEMMHRFHMLTTSIIEIAEDGQTAKAYWYTPGMVGTGWMYENYACDFIKEDGEWKTWHRTVFAEFSTALDKSWTDIPEGPGGGGEMMPSGKDIQVVAFEEWSPERSPQYKPKAPVPYKSFNETFSYCPPMPEDVEEMLWRENLMF
jgi:hypothetical protein